MGIFNMKPLFTLLPVFVLDDSPPPSRRALAARNFRQTEMHKWSNVAYDSTEGLMKCLKRSHKRNVLSPPVACRLGVATTAEVIWKHRKEFRLIMRELKLTTAKQLWAAHGKCGAYAWSWDHINPIRFMNHHDPASIARFLHSDNLRPVIACRNHWCKFETPLQHLWLLQLDGRDAV